MSERKKAALCRSSSKVTRVYQGLWCRLQRLYNKTSGFNLIQTKAFESHVDSFGTLIQTSLYHMLLLSSLSYLFTLIQSWTVMFISLALFNFLQLISELQVIFI